ncbi:hypothetical protein [Holospora curviuscula]|uniref:Uncharacterized protein n=1 Tax=Holospora curviuscula TaxID=1082868 RepID=A0A2S5RDG6_9PROT|nr:hypothetical protein [Holospora curviuscula]PPE05361.1 hypothetical protein HCUR_00320 [Holospora curviuscula]
MRKLNFKYVYFLAMINVGAFAVLTPEQAEQNKNDFLIYFENLRIGPPNMYKISTADWKKIEKDAMFYVSQYVERSKFDLFKTKLCGLILETLERIQQGDSEQIRLKITLAMEDSVACSLNDLYSYVHKKDLEEPLLPYNVPKLDTLVESYLKYARTFKDPEVLKKVKKDLEFALIRRHQERNDCPFETIEKFMNDPAFQRLGHQPQQLEKKQQQEPVNPVLIKHAEPQPQQQQPQQWQPQQWQPQQQHQRQLQNIEVNQFNLHWLTDEQVQQQQQQLQNIEVNQFQNDPFYGGEFTEDQIILIAAFTAQQDEEKRSADKKLKETFENIQKQSNEFFDNKHTKELQDFIAKIKNGSVGNAPLEGGDNIIKKVKQDEKN